MVGVSTVGADLRFGGREMSYILSFEIAGLPKLTNPKSGGSVHWRVIHGERTKWKNTVLLILKSRTLPEKPLEKAKLTLTRHSSVCPDSDGLVSGFKAIIDALVIGKVLVNDKFVNIGMPDYRWEKAKPGKGKVSITVAEIA